MVSCGLNKRNMKRTDKEIIDAMTFIKEQHNGEMPYQFGTFECAKMMAKYLKKQLTIHVVSTRSFNELEMLAEDLECVKMWLDDKKSPKTDINGNEYSVVGRIQCLLNVC